jgi:prepilin-type N-terminal cleavage/methylation domain-containing protein
MKPSRSNQSCRAFTLVEVAVVVAVVTVLVVIILPKLAGSKSGRRATCVNNLKEIGMSYRLWAGDNNERFPMEISVTNGGTMELVATGNVVATFQTMSNQLSTPKILACQQDKEHFAARNFGAGLTSKNISYFIGLDAKNNQQPQMIMSGDDNLTFGNVPMKSGLLLLSPKANVVWTSSRHTFDHPPIGTLKRHQIYGNLCFGDGSVQMINNSSLNNYFQQTGLATNRLAIP